MSAWYTKVVYEQMKWEFLIYDVGFWKQCIKLCKYLPKHVLSELNCLTWLTDLSHSGPYKNCSGLLCPLRGNNISP
jgi:hypothetical protein